MSKSRITKQDIEIPRLELKATHVLTSLATNIMKVLKGYNRRSVRGWTDSTVVLRWLKHQVSYKVFVENQTNFKS